VLTYDTLKDKKMTEQAVAIPEKAKAEVATEDNHHHETYLKPPVDIFETSEGIVLLADVPGLAQDDLDVSVDRGILTIRGSASREGASSNGHRHGAKAAVFRQFRLGDTIDPEHIAAELKHGVLRLHLPKAEAHRARKVDVKVS
jgi:HSP20 family molecular chaperone IbpA